MIGDHRGDRDAAGDVDGIPSALNDGSGGGGDHAGGRAGPARRLPPCHPGVRDAASHVDGIPAARDAGTRGDHPGATGEVVRFWLCSIWGAWIFRIRSNPARPRPSVPHRGGLHGRRHLDRERRAGFSVPDSPWMRHKPIPFEAFVRSEEARKEAWRRKFAMDDLYREARRAGGTGRSPPRGRRENAGGDAEHRRPSPGRGRPGRPGDRAPWQRHLCPVLVVRTQARA